MTTLRHDQDPWAHDSILSGSALPAAGGTGKTLAAEVLAHQAVAAAGDLAGGGASQSDVPDHEPWNGVYVGTEGVDEFTDHGGSAAFYLLGGNDTIGAGESDNIDLNHEGDTLDGGAGIDTLRYASISDGAYVHLGDGIAYRIASEATANAGSLIDLFVGQFYAPDLLNDFENVIGSEQDDELHGDGGANVLDGRDGDDEINGHGDNDTLDGGFGADTLMGGSGNDSMIGNYGDDSMHGESGHDTISGGQGEDTAEGGTGNDWMLGGRNDDLLEGEDGNDTFDGGNENDTIDGGDDNDVLRGGSDDDLLLGGGGHDTMEGGDGHDALDAGAGIDTLRYTTTADVGVNLDTGWVQSGIWLDLAVGFENVSTGAGDDALTGDAAANVFWAGSGADAVHGGGGDDRAHGDGGADSLYGGDGEDELRGGSQNDRLDGGDDVDELYGDAGNDLLLGGDGADIIRGGTGIDNVRWQRGDEGIDQLADFDPGEDKISFGSRFFAEEPGSLDDMAEMLAVVSFGIGDAVLMADTADGWQAIAQFDHSLAADVAAGIADHSIFAAPVVGIGGGLPGDLDFG